MPRQSQTDNVRKRCTCVKWKTCSHPWYLDFRQDNLRFRDCLDKLIDRHCEDFAEAKQAARRAILAKLEAHDPKGLLPQDDPTLAALLTAYHARQEAKPREAEQHGPITRTLVHGKPFGTYRLSTITHETLEAFQDERPRVSGNRNLSYLRMAFKWAIRKKLLTHSPFVLGGEVAVSLRNEEPRSRRLHPGEDARLLMAAGRLSDVIVAALETGCRKGELLSLQWHQVRFAPKAELFLPAGKTKAKKDRRIPISSVLAAILTRRRTDPAGAILPFEAYVFGDEIGRPRVSIKTAWRGTLQRAQIPDLHFHDLRREAGSRWMDAGVPLATIQRWLGHANIAQTSTYLGASLGGDESDMRRFEERIGRGPVTSHPVTPVTQSDLFASATPPERDRTGPTSSDFPQQNRKSHKPTPVVH
jgi:integrase